MRHKRTITLVLVVWLMSCAAQATLLDRWTHGEPGTMARDRLTPFCAARPHAAISLRGGWLHLSVDLICIWW